MLPNFNSHLIRRTRTTRYTNEKSQESQNYLSSKKKKKLTRTEFRCNLITIIEPIIFLSRTRNMAFVHTPTLNNKTCFLFLQYVHEERNSLSTRLENFAWNFIWPRPSRGFRMQTGWKKKARRGQIRNNYRAVSLCSLCSRVITSFALRVCVRARKLDKPDSDVSTKRSRFQWFTRAGASRRD